MESRTKWYRLAGFTINGKTDAEIISSLLLWRPSYGKSRGRKLSFPDVISRDTGLSTEKLRTAMRDRDIWCGIVQSMVATAVD